VDSVAFVYYLSVPSPNVIHPPFFSELLPPLSFFTLSTIFFTVTLLCALSVAVATRVVKVKWVGRDVGGEFHYSSLLYPLDLSTYSPYCIKTGSCCQSCGAETISVNIIRDIRPLPPPLMGFTEVSQRKFAAIRRHFPTNFVRIGISFVLILRDGFIC
jgi:hypothetical protein